ncbi:MAG: chemotaxis response regulator protein-glutamate methylesterase [bacterium]
MAPIRVLIVDDSAFMRKSLSIILGSDPEVEIVGTARDGLEGFELTKKLTPDLVTLDIEMPKMDGLTALKKIMAECPTTVIMVSSLTTEGAESTLKALELGAVDFIPKEMSFVSVNIVGIKDELLKKIKYFGRKKSIRATLNRIQILRQTRVQTPVVPISTLTDMPKIGYKAVAIGISTGGPLSLQKVIPRLAGNIGVPVFIVQHMPPKFTKSLADRLNSMSQLNVKEAENNEEVKSNNVYIAPGGFHMTAVKNGSTVKISINSEPSTTLHRPSVDVMVQSLVGIYGKNLMGIIMTGMGRDGLLGIQDLKKLGGYALAQDEESCVVYGMPKAVVDAGCADVVAPLEKISDIINKAL